MVKTDSDREALMKPFFGFDITKKKFNDSMYADAFISRTPSEEARAEIERLNDKMDEETVDDIYPSNRKRAAVSVRLLLSLLPFGVTALLARRLDISILWPTLLLGVGIFVFVLLLIRLKRKEKEAPSRSDKELDRILDALDEATARVLDEMGVPRDANDVEILFFRFKMENGEPRMKEPYPSNCPMTIFVQNDALCLASSVGVYELPLSSLKRICTVNEVITFFSWLKDEPCTSPLYAPYVTERQDGAVSLSTYHILECSLNGEDYGIYFPAYELPTFEEMTALRAEATL